MSDSISETVLALQAQNELLKMHPLICPYCQEKMAAQDEVEAMAFEFGLSPKEQEIFQILFRSFGRLVAYDTIFNQLYGHDPNGGPDYGNKIVSVYFHHIRKKLPSCYQIQIVWGRGGILSMVGR